MAANSLSNPTAELPESGYADDTALAGAVRGRPALDPPTVEIDVRQLVSPAAAARQEVALEHAAAALRLIEELLELEEVSETHRSQIEEGREFLARAVDYLGPVVEFRPAAGDAVMSAEVIEICSPWQQAADASDRIEELLTEIPGWDGYELLEATQIELRQAAALLHQVIGLLAQASAREVPRCDELTERNGGWSPGIEP